MADVIVAPSVLSADFSRLDRAVAQIDASGAAWTHLDVMDGSFVPNLTFGPKTVADLRPLTKSFFDVHLMVEHPETFIDDFAKAGADAITFHIEASVHAHRVLQRIAASGKKPGISIVPSTPVSMIEELLPFVYQVLVMTVNPGFGGQSMIPECLAKARTLARIREERGLDFLIAADGGINESTAPAVREAGVQVLIAGSAFFGASNQRAFVDALMGRKPAVC